MKTANHFVPKAFVASVIAFIFTFLSLSALGDTPFNTYGVSQLIIDEIINLREQGFSDEELLTVGFSSHALEVTDKYLNGALPTIEPPTEEELERERLFNEYYEYYLCLGDSEELARDKAGGQVYVYFDAHNQELIEYDPMQDPEYLEMLNSSISLQPSISDEIREILAETKNPLNNENVDSFSRLDYLAIYAASGKLDESRLRSKKRFLFATEEVFAPHPVRYYMGTQFEETYNSLISSGDIEKKTNLLSEEISILQEEYAKAYDDFSVWKSTATETMAGSMEYIMRTFDDALSELESHLNPVSNSIKGLQEKLEKLNDHEKKLFQLTGIDNNGTPVNDQAKDCLYLLKKQQDELQSEYDTLAEAYDNLSENPEYGTNNKTTSNYNKSLKNAKSKMNTAKSKLDKFNKTVENKEKQIEQAKNELDNILEDVIMTIFNISNYNQYLQAFKTYLGFDPRNNERYSDWETFKKHTMLNYYDISAWYSAFDN